MLRSLRAFFQRKPPAIRITIDADGVRRALQGYIESSTDEPEVLAIAKTHHALPLWRDMGGVLYLQPDGHIIASTWDVPGRVKPVADIRPHRDMLHAARAKAGRKYPEIQGLTPEKGPGAVPCRSSDGHGNLLGMSIQPGDVLCGCGGLGWLPEPPEPR